MNGSMSEWEEVSSGDPQGSALALVFLNMFINHLDARIESFLVKFTEA